jgi:hypothetical protein
MVIVVAMGLRPMLDGSIDVGSVEVTRALVRIRVKMTVLQDGCTVPAVAGYPVDIALVPKARATSVVTFVEQYRPETCKP